MPDLAGLPSEDVARLLVLAAKHGLRPPADRPRGWGLTWGFGQACDFVTRYARHCGYHQLLELARLLDGLQAAVTPVTEAGTLCRPNAKWLAARAEVQRLAEARQPRRRVAVTIVYAPREPAQSLFATLPERV